ncbi:hypothetical protein [Marinicellulosiphila megalodicopiae]|uniref:hypothetical protein n=1 Tax=Marinicellulosiphila megalodicopiae TaxID=2724896 RepID=UPI003BB02066
MKLNFLIECDDFEDYFKMHQKALNKINDWLESSNENENVSLVDLRLPAVANIDDYDPFNPPKWQIGLSIQTKKVKALKLPINFLNGLCKDLKVDISVNKVIDEQNKTISYFGTHDGRGDIFEIWQLADY